MSALVNQRRRGLETPIPAPWAAVIAYAMVVFVFIGDWVTPASVVVGLAYEAPVVFAALKGTKRLTILTIALSSLGVVFGWFADLAQANFLPSDERIENRLFSLVSIWIVGSLALVIHHHAQRAQLDKRQAVLRRETALSSAMERVMSAPSPEATIQALAGEAPRMLEAAAAAWCPTQPDETFWVTEGASGAKASDVKPSAGFKALVQRLSSQRSVEVVSAAESIDYLAGKPLGAKDALAIPIGDGSNVVGIVFATFDSGQIDEHRRVAAGNFAKFAAIAVQAHSAARLAHRSDPQGERFIQGAA